MKPVKVGIMPYEQYKNYTIGIARGQIKPKKSDPKIWFDSIESPAGKKAICHAH